MKTDLRAKQARVLPDEAVWAAIRVAVSEYIKWTPTSGALKLSVSE
jgi:hypothetical protein